MSTSTSTPPPQRTSHHSPSPLPSATEALELLQTLQSNHELTLTKLAESLGPSKDLGPKARAGRAGRSGGGDGHDDEQEEEKEEEDDDDGEEEVTPAGLQAELEHYKELFSKLRLSYISQVTKEKFLRNVTSATPVYVEPTENEVLEQTLIEKKAGLKEQKEEVNRLTEELDRRSRDLVARYQTLISTQETLQTLLQSIPPLQSEIRTLKQARSPPPSPLPLPPTSSSPSSFPPASSLALPLANTISILESQESHLSAIDSEIAALEIENRESIARLGRSEAETEDVRRRKAEEERKLSEVKGRIEMEELKGWGKEMEGKGRWYLASDVVLNDIWAGK